MTDSLMSLWGSFERGMGIQTNGAFLNLVQEEEVSCSLSLASSGEQLTSWLRLAAGALEQKPPLPQAGEKMHRSPFVVFPHLLLSLRL